MSGQRIVGCDWRLTLAFRIQIVHLPHALQMLVTLLPQLQLHITIRRCYNWRVLYHTHQLLQLWSFDLLFEGDKLSLETDIWNDARPSLLNTLERVVHAHTVLFDQVGDDNGGWSGNAGVAVNQATAPVLKGELDKSDARREVLFNILPGDIHNWNHFVCEVRWKTRVQPSQDLQHVCYTLYF